MQLSIADKHRQPRARGHEPTGTFGSVLDIAARTMTIKDLMDYEGGNKMKRCSYIMPSIR